MLLRVEEKLRACCEACATGIFCPFMALVSLYSACTNAWWSARPLLVEYTLARHQLAMAAAALAFFVASEDKAGHRSVAWFLEVGTDFCASGRWRKLYTSSLRRGKKKQL